MMIKIIVVSILIVLVVLVLFAIAVTKGYSYKHTIDPIDNNANLDSENKNDPNNK
jgi:hypothetical protein